MVGPLPAPGAGPGLLGRRGRLVALAALLLFEACAHTPPASRPARPGASEHGMASWYGAPYHGRRTASDERYDMHRLTAAHRTLPFGTLVRVTRRDSGAGVEVRVNDRGPFVRDRVIDLSYEAARRIDLDRDGTAPVELVVVGSAPAPHAEPGEVEESGDEICLWVQVGAFGDIDNARRARRRLDAAGEHAVISEGPHRLHRVRVGPFASEIEARQARERLLAEWPPAQLVGCG